MSQIPQMECSHPVFMLKKQDKLLQSRTIIPALFGILVIGITQFGYAEEFEESTYIAVDVEGFEQPQSKYNYEEITIIGHVEDYSRGDKLTIQIINPDETQEEINTYASKKGDIYTMIHITIDSQIGIHEVILTYQGMEIASTSFEILENQ
ncbi:hypothetical protein BD31_I0177 [Candidatus Nitrosopumilus salaria BD31]|uniref:Uncharacterized protein n=2 Tax=Nitrosopumilus TaxID=338191 RepID=I3D288_9ARCH|nr:hypothetical protein BD31_I0177 [Candidatus Nitrosopumilus salaria BD31]